MAHVIKNSSAGTRAICTAPSVQHFWQVTSASHLIAIQIKRLISVETFDSDFFFFF